VGPFKVTSPNPLYRAADSATTSTIDSTPVTESAPQPETTSTTAIDTMDLSASTEAPPPINNVESGIQPLAPFLAELEAQPEPAPPRTDAAVPGTQEEDATAEVHTNGDVDMNTDKAGESMQVDAMPAAGVDGSNDVPIASADTLPIAATPEVAMTEAQASVKVAREREDDDEGEPMAKRARTQEHTSVTNGGVAHPAEVPVPTIEQGITAEAQTHVDTAPSSSAAAPSSSARTAASSGAPQIDFGPMTDAQHKLLDAGIKNLKKSRNAVFFQKPVDHVLLKIPTYPDIIKQPMDLSTMEKKVKGKEYQSVNAYIADFDLMVQNSIRFNGPAHTVSQAGTMLRSQLDAQLRKIPRPGDGAVAVPEPAPKKKKKTPVPASVELKQRRQSKPAPVPQPAAPPPPTLYKEETYALDTNGMPQIRRMSTSDGRPKREIKAPARELPYSQKPKKKKYQAELKFCQEVIGELRKPRWQATVAPFAIPVDPVAFNLPTYRSIVKKPMDISTIQEKLNQGHYQNAKEFAGDFNLMCENCYKFNGPDHVVSKMAQDIQAHISSSMAKKDDWLAKHAPRSAPQSPDASDSEQDDEEDEDDDEGEDANLTAIQKQMAALAEQLQLLQNKGKLSKSKDKKVKSSSKSSKKTSTGGGSLPIRSDKKSKPKAAPKALRPITTAQKEEISTRIGLLGAEDIAQAANLIKEGLRAAGKQDLADRPEDEMEFEIDEIPDATLHELLKLVRKNAPTDEPTVEDTDYKPAKANVPANSGKSRKNKPMSKTEQEKRISELKNKIANFEGGGAGSSPDGELCSFLCCCAVMLICIKQVKLLLSLVVMRKRVVPKVRRNEEWTMIRAACCCSVTGFILFSILHRSRLAKTPRQAQ
jgi:bromodomain-containing factor 1